MPPTQHSVVQSSQPGIVDSSDTMSMQGIHSVIAEKPVSNVPKKNNKFSTLVKSNEEGYLLSTRMVHVPDSEKIYIEEFEVGRFRWLPTGESYNCIVTSPKKESKLKGLKSFIVYQLTPTVSFILTEQFPFFTNFFFFHLV